VLRPSLVLAWISSSSAIDADRNTEIGEQLELRLKDRIPKL
jgi:hypothetical protein